MGIYVARHLSFLRGYAYVAAGLLPVPPKVFIPAVVDSAITWSDGWVIAGRLLGTYREDVSMHVGYYQSLVWQPAVTNRCRLRP